MNLAADWVYIQDLANKRRRENQTQWHIDEEYLETLGAAGELAARRFLGLDEALHEGFDDGVDLLWKGWKVDVKTTLLTRKIGYRYLQWPENKPIKADIVFMVTVDLESQEAVPVGFATRQELEAAPVNTERKYPCREIPFVHLHAPWEMYAVSTRR
jgi:hypothetical protein